MPPDIYRGRFDAADDDAKPLLREITVPTLVIQDTAASTIAAILDSANELAASIPNASLEIIPDLPFDAVNPTIASRLNAAPVSDWPVPDARTLLFTYAKTSRSLGTEVQVTDREVEVLVLVAHGLKHKEIAENLTLVPSRVARHLHNILAKTGLPNRAALATYATEHIHRASDDR